MKVVYIAHPLRGSLDRNLRRAAEWVRWAAVHKGVCPIAPYIAFCKALDDGDHDERRLGMMLDLVLLERADELWLCGPKVSTGMAQEADRMHGLGKPVVDLTGPTCPRCAPGQQPETVEDFGRCPCREAA